MIFVLTRLWWCVCDVGPLHVPWWSSSWTSRNRKDWIHQRSGQSLGTFVCGNQLWWRHGLHGKKLPLLELLSLDFHMPEILFLFPSILTRSATFSAGCGQDLVWPRPVWCLGLFWWIQSNWCFGVVSDLLPDTDHSQCSHLASQKVSCMCHCLTERETFKSEKRCKRLFWAPKLSLNYLFGSI